MLPDSLALNPKSLDNLRLQAKQENGKEAVRGAAQQFESYFLQMMLRTMRQTLSQDGPFDSQETRMFSEMFDQQVAQSISQSKGLGLADMLVQQMQLSLETQKIKAAPRPYDLPPVAQLSEAAVSGAAASAGEAGGKAMTPRSFVDKLWPHAVDAAAVLGVSPHILLAQAALETGWGKHVFKAADGTDSNNLFNIKAGSRWEGPTVAKEVTEYVNGKPVKSVETFRAYDTPAEAFADYASLLSTNPRYAGVLNQDAEGFISGLRQGGFATDPGYGDKLRRIIGSVALRQGMAA